MFKYTFYALQNHYTVHSLRFPLEVHFLLKTNLTTLLGVIWKLPFSLLEKF